MDSRPIHERALHLQRYFKETNSISFWNEEVQEWCFGMNHLQELSSRDIALDGVGGQTVERDASPSFPFTMSFAQEAGILGIGGTVSEKILRTID